MNFVKNDFCDKKQSVINFRHQPISLLSKARYFSEVGRTWYFLNQSQFVSLMMACIADNLLFENSLVVEARFFSSSKFLIEKLKIIEHCHLQISLAAFRFDEINEFYQCNNTQLSGRVVKLAIQKSGEFWLL
ncbi:MAG: hypothetical protein HQL46_12310 [Gammaproteobacteria bacterium]|nr:hypothetical protein [Gammaproteobacteria bacterium]